MKYGQFELGLHHFRKKKKLIAIKPHCGTFRIMQTSQIAQGYPNILFRRGPISFSTCRSVALIRPYRAIRRICAALLQTTTFLNSSRVSICTK